jgi:methionyl-tRNA formyltransferase
MFQKKQLSCYVIGEDSLTIECMQLLLEKECHILGVISSTPLIISWVMQKSLPIFHSIDQWLSSVKKFDYLFSIVNSVILTEKVIALPRFFSINYHDALLPKYAGVHATSWAILNSEKMHGISWHKISTIVDGGEILKQSSFKIDDDETTLSLNLKCYEHAKIAFNELLDELIHQTYTLKHQDQTKRTYYGIDEKPKTCGFIDWTFSATDICRLFRALYFGKYPNRFCSFKFIHFNRIVIVDKLNILSSLSDKKPGTILSINKTGLTVSTTTFDILLQNFWDKDHGFYDSTNDLIHFLFKIDDVFDSPSPQIIMRLSKSKSLKSINEAYWIGLFRSVDTNTPYFFPYYHALMPKNVDKNIYIKPADCVVNAIKKSFNVLGIKNQYSLIAIFIGYIFRLNHNQSFTIYFSQKTLRDKTKGLENILSNYIPVMFSLDSMELNVQSLIDETQSILQKNQVHGTFFYDINVRYTCFKKMPTIPIAINVCSDLELDSSLNANSVLQFNISASEIIFNLRIDNAIIKDKTNHYLFNPFLDCLQQLLQKKLSFQKND